MDDDGSMEIDSAIAAAMGFSGFGTQPGKKRKFHANDAFADPDAAEASRSAKGQIHAKGANKLPLGARKQTSSAAVDNAKTVPHDRQQHNESISSKEANGNHSLEALRLGIRNEQGDIAYFMPSFIADPWQDLKPQ